MKQNVEVALRMVLWRINQNTVPQELERTKFAFSALLMSWISRIDNPTFFKNLFPNRGELYNKLRVIEMVQNDIALFDDEDIADQLSIAPLDDEGDKEELPVEDIKNMEPSISIYDDNGTRITMHHPARLIMFCGKDIKRVAKYNDFNKKSKITVDEKKGIINFHKNSRSVLPKQSLKICPDKLKEILAFI